MYVVVTQNAFNADYPGVGHIAGPEALLAEYFDVGIFTAELDMAHLRTLRRTLYDYQTLDSTGLNEDRETLATRPGQQRLRRPSIFGKLVLPKPGDFDYDYYLKEIALGTHLDNVAGYQEAAE